MGRPVRYGGGEMRGFAERARYMVAIAHEALADLRCPRTEARFNAHSRASRSASC